METKNESHAQIKGTQIITTRVVNAPRELVFEAWTDPRHLDKWWGPNGFVTVTESFDFKVGGSWKFTMSHPEFGTYPEHVVFDEITPPEKLMYTHVGYFTSDVTFTEHDGKTTVRMCGTFESEDAVKEVVEKYHAVEGGKQTLEKMGVYVEAGLN